jgi:hypothetical protein
VGRYLCRQTNPSAPDTAIAASSCHHFLRSYGARSLSSHSVLRWRTGCPSLRAYCPTDPSRRRTHAHPPSRAPRHRSRKRQDQARTCPA